MINLIISFIIIFLLLLLLLYLFPIVTVVGDSMFPTFSDGDMLVSTRLFNKTNCNDDDILVYNAPYKEDFLVVKRLMRRKVNNLNKVKYYLVGDNLKNSYDSRVYGYVDCDLMIAKVLFRIKKSN